MSVMATSADGSAVADRVYRDLLRTIIQGELKPGEWLKERELSERFNVSRVPVRQALQRLEGEGFVLMSRHRGATLTPITRADVEEIFDARLCIEPYAARRAAQRVGHGLDSADRLREIFDAVHPSGGGLSESSLAFHLEIVRLSGNRILERSLRPMLGRMDWIFHVAQTTMANEHAEDHRQILASIVAGRGEVAAAQSYAHLDEAKDQILDALAVELDWD